MIKRIPTFAAGTHVDSRGRKRAWTDADVAQSAKIYDPALHAAPLVIGHPQNNAPTFGTIGALEFAEHATKGGVKKFLDAIPASVHPVFERMVGEGLFGYRSASFWPPDHPSNPTASFAEADRGWYLRHVGFVPIPAVKGLPPVELSEGENDLAVVSFADDGAVEFTERVRVEMREGAVEFAEVPNSLAWALQSIKRLFTASREKMIEKDGVEAADKLLPSWEIDDIQRAVDDLQKPPAESAQAVAPAYSDPNQGDGMSDKTAEFAEREQKLDAREQKIVARERELARAEAADFVEGLIKGTDGKGRIHPREKAGLVEFLAGDADVLEFSEGEGDAAKTVSIARTDYLKGFLSRLPALVDFSEVSGTEKGEAPTLTDEQLATKAAEYAEEHGVDMIEAVLAVQAGKDAPKS